MGVPQHFPEAEALGIRCVGERARCEAGGVIHAAAATAGGPGIAVSHGPPTLFATRKHHLT
jgi:hypothetical protein